MNRRYRYVIIGGGLAGASAARGIRQLDKDGPMLILSAEAHPPYDRPPLSKKLWLGKKKVGDIFLNTAAWYAENGVELRLSTRAASIDRRANTVVDSTGRAYGYEKLLIATGGEPRRLGVPGGSLEEVTYYRYLDDFTRVRELAKKGSRALVVGGGFIGSEMAAALNQNGVEVTLVFPSRYICNRVFPEGLGLHMVSEFGRRGIRCLSGTNVTAFERRGAAILARTSAGEPVEADFVIAGAGIAPSTGLASSAGLSVDDGIEVDGFLRTSDPDIYAAGDVARFQCAALGKRTRVEHWDNALTQGGLAGENMAGAGREYLHMPYFFSDLFEFGYEAVGEVDPSLEVTADWREEYARGILYYMRDGAVRGVMCCGVWDKMDEARSLIKSGRRFGEGSVRGAIGL